MFSEITAVENDASEDLSPLAILIADAKEGRPIVAGPFLVYNRMAIQTLQNQGEANAAKELDKASQQVVRSAKILSKCIELDEESPEAKTALSSLNRNVTVWEQCRDGITGDVSSKDPMEDRRSALSEFQSSKTGASPLRMLVKLATLGDKSGVEPFLAASNSISQSLREIGAKREAKQVDKAGKKVATAAIRVAKGVTKGSSMKTQEIARKKLTLKCRGWDLACFTATDLLRKQSASLKSSFTNGTLFWMVFATSVIHTCCNIGGLTFRLSSDYNYQKMNPTYSRQVMTQLI
jgi:hypothetical protein